MSKILIVITTLVCVSAAFGAGQDRGGGDICEDKIKVIRDDLKSWIDSNGHAELILPKGISAGKYAKAMLYTLSKAKIQCLGKNDVGFPITVNYIPKICIFDLKNFTISCDRESFLGLEDDEQYRLTHHEFAGLAKLENPNKSDSSYEISNQISGFLEFKTVKRLVVKKRVQTSLSLGTLEPAYPQQSYVLGSRKIYVTNQPKGLTLNGSVSYGNKSHAWYTVVYETIGGTGNEVINSKGKLQVVYGSVLNGGIICEYDVQVKLSKMSSGYSVSYQFPLNVAPYVSTPANICPILNTNTIWQYDNIYQSIPGN